MSGSRNISSWSERQQVLAILLMAGAVIVLIAYFILLPMNQNKKRIERQIRDMSSRLLSQNYGGDEKTLFVRLHAEERFNLTVRKDLETLMSRLATFPDQRDLVSTNVSHIDFKVALHAAEAGVAPYKLGMDDAVDSDEDPRVLTLQLRAAERILNIATNSGILEIDRVEPMPLVDYRAGTRDDLYMEELPVFLSCQCDMKSLFALFAATLDQSSACVIRRIRIRKVALGARDSVRVDAVISALLFPKTLDEIAWPVVVKETQIINPGGA